YVRQDRVAYTPSADPFDDMPATVSQNRRLTNFGAKVDLAYTAGAHNVKVGGTVDATKLTENFTLGFTDPTANSPCFLANGLSSPDPRLRSTSQCLAPLIVNSTFSPGLLPFDLTRGGGLFTFNQADTIKTQAFYVQDDIRAGQATIKLGLR